MFKVLVLAGVVAVASAIPSYGGYGGYGYGGGYAHGPISAAIQSHHNIHTYPVHSYGHRQAVYVDVPGSAGAIYMNFRTRSSKLVPTQFHEGQAGSFQESQSQDEPHLLRHTVTKPVMQEVREIVTPFRRITQEIQPVQEQVQTLVARNAGGLAGAGGAAGALAGAGLAGAGFGGAGLAAAGGFAGAGLGGGAILAGAGLGAGLGGGYGGHGMILAGGHGGKY